MNGLRRHPGAALATVAVLVFTLAAASALRTPFPVVLSDEVNYLLPALHGYSEENFARWSIVAAIPNHLYYAIYGALAGPDAYPHAKLLNAALLAAAVFPIHAVARTRLASDDATLLAALAAAAPVTSYARYFMPEALYNLGFWIATLLVLRALPRSVLLAALVAGLSTGVLSLVKPHALALAVGMAAFLALREGDLRRRLGAAALVAATYVAARLLLAAALTGHADASLAGPAYAGMLRGGFDPWDAARNALGHVAALLLLAGVPLWVISRHVAQAWVRGARVEDVALLALCVLAALVAMTVLFSSSVHVIAPATERITRLHGRYYAFALPLVIIAFAVVSRPSPVRRPGRRAAMAWAALTLAAAWVVGSYYEAGFVDFPDLSLLTRWPGGLAIAGIAAAGCLVAARHARERQSACVLPLAWWGSIIVVTTLVLLAAPFAGRAFKPGAIDEALATPALRALVGRDDVLIVGSRDEPVGAYRVLFHLASRARGRLEPAGAVVAPTQVPDDVRLLILLPGIAYGGAADTAEVGPLRLVTAK